ncbi:MAG: succinate dehydrogenase, cytochrome b556 subunit [Chloroflexi bacterium]|nr:succinate dehydrogenase, cytochrome b556 subunit [Chloroflexota bacterium]MCI0580525.1 succinate dehydrogenase, cytochrome b556 subunit [Chloroflexota bacterium]MCI0648124.1 succinate dehydrogenase, cytochrome b556 subunit [Chloroflexota bacterium]MCI0731632.1 succinate dehydrogenase, cytochrome b556 subunit [Chloroflexota bacterium]
MIATLTRTARDSVRYRGMWGHWSWIAHRISGLAVLSFLIVHVWDTANATFWPEAYSYTVEVFKWFPFSVGEILLMAAVLFHAYNGIRITLLDFKPEWWEHQRPTAIAVWALFLATYIPIGLFMFSRTLAHCSELAAEGASCWSFPLP